MSEPVPKLRFVGGGLVVGGEVDELPPIYDHEVCRLLRQIENKVWQDWWNGSSNLGCEVFYWVGGSRSRVSSRLTKNRLRVAIDRHIDREKGATSDPGTDAARSDADLLVAYIASRIGADPAPAWRGEDEQ